MSKKRRKVTKKELEKGLRAVTKAIAELEGDFIRDHDAIWDRIDRGDYKRQVHNLKLVTENATSAIAHVMVWAMKHGYEPAPGTVIKHRLTGEAIATGDEPLPPYEAGTEVVETSDDADSSGRPFADNPPSGHPKHVRQDKVGGITGDLWSRRLHEDGTESVHSRTCLSYACRGACRPHRYTADENTPVMGPCCICDVPFTEHPPAPTMRDWGEAVHKEREITPGACGDPMCPVLHADPANPIHPPDYQDSREGLQPILEAERNLQDLETRPWYPGGGRVINTIHHVDCVLPTRHDPPCYRRRSAEPEVASDAEVADVDPLGDGGCANLECLLDSSHEGDCQFPDRSPISHGFEDPRHNQRPWKVADVDPGKVEGGKVW